jgi:hypothetical protein
MKLLLKIERKSPGGVSETTTELLEGETISIGRGAGAQIRFRDPQLSAVQVVLEISSDELIVREIGRTGLTFINGQAVKATAVRAGDQIKVGTHTVIVEQIDGLWSLNVDQASFEERIDDQALILAQLKSFSIQEKLPSLLTLSLAVLFLFSFLYFLLPVVTEDKDVWSSGPVSAAHKFIERDCQACHIEPFKQVRDAECAVCHNVNNHAPAIEKARHSATFASQRCVDCHQEHNGKEGIHLRDARSCVSCHGDIKRTLSESQIESVKDFSSHPEFRITTSHQGEKKRAIVGSPEALDTTPLKLNHALHLKSNIRGPKGNVTLQCSDCHATDQRSREIKPVSFESNCRSCHSLEFDPKFPGLEVPHGDSQRIKEFLRAHYSQLLLQPEQKNQTDELIRIKPGMGKEASMYNRATLQLLDQTVFDAEEILYKKTGCQLCHLADQERNLDLNKSAFKIQDPQIPNTWLTKAEFSHRPHQHMKCQDCHTAAEKSEKTQDLLLPQINSCRDCHADRGVKGKVDSDCVECHSYH